MITQERLKELLHYDPETGVFTRNVTTNNNAHAGDVAGSPHIKGYVQIQVDSHVLLAHRLAWFYTYGEFPHGMLDHHDQDKTNNRMSNLRPVTNKQNLENTKVSSNNKSGFKGVCAKGSKWLAYITHCYKRIHLGYFDTPEEASAAYEAMRDILFTHHKKTA